MLSTYKVRSHALTRCHTDISHSMKLTGMSMRVHGIGSSNRYVAEQTEAMAAYRVVGTGDYTSRASMMPRRPNSTKGIPSLQERGGCQVLHEGRAPLHSTPNCLSHQAPVLLALANVV